MKSRTTVRAAMGVLVGAALALSLVFASPVQRTQVRRGALKAPSITSAPAPVQKSVRSGERTTLVILFVPKPAFDAAPLLTVSATVPVPEHTGPTGDAPQLLQARAPPLVSA